MKKLLSVVCLLALVTALFAGCTSRDNDNTSSSSTMPENSSSSTSMLPSEPSTGSSDTSTSDTSSSDTTSSTSTTPTMNADFSQIGVLDVTKQGWGIGPARDADNRPTDPITFNKKYSSYHVKFIEEDSKDIYLTFDEGYENGYTAPILDTLKEKGVTGVFFVTLPYVKSNPDLIKRMIDEGHVVGNHSTAHLSFPTMPLQAAYDDILELHDYMKENYNYEMTLFRFPMGEFNEQTLALLTQMNYTSLFWSFAYQDWDIKNQPDPATALQKLTNAAHPGAIYLIHAVSKTNSQVLGEFIDNVKAKGFTIAPCSELAA